MNSTKYIGLDVHKETISIAVLNSSGKLVMECILETKASMILQFVQDYAESCTSDLKKEPGRPGYMTVCPGKG